MGVTQAIHGADPCGRVAAVAAVRVARDRHAAGGRGRGMDRG